MNLLTNPTSCSANCSTERHTTLVQYIGECFRSQVEIWNVLCDSLCLKSLKGHENLLARKIPLKKVLLAKNPKEIQFDVEYTLIMCLDNFKSIFRCLKAFFISLLEISFRWNYFPESLLRMISSIIPVPFCFICEFCVCCVYYCRHLQFCSKLYDLLVRLLLPSTSNVILVFTSWLLCDQRLLENCAIGFVFQLARSYFVLAMGW